MTDRRDRPSGASTAPHRPPTALIKSESPTDATVLWRVGAWSGIAILAIAAAILIARSPVAARHGALGDAQAVITAQAKQLQHVIQQNDSETRRLAAALNTLNADRDRLYRRVTDLERSLETVTGSISRLSSLPARTASTPPPVLSTPQSVPAALKPEIPGAEPAMLPDIAPVAATPKIETTASVAPKPVIAPILAPIPAPVTPLVLDKAAEPAVAETARPKPAPKLPLGIDLGSASSIEGLRAIWDSTRKAHGAAIEGLEPVITIQEPKNGLGLQLRLVAGPLPDASGVAKRCAPLIEATRPCASAVFDGQRLPPRDASIKPAATAKPPKAARSEPKAAPKAQRSTFPTLFGGN